MAALKILIAVMAVLIVVALGAVVWRIAVLIGNGGDDNGGAAALAPRISLGLPSACAIAGMTVGGGGRLASVTVTGPGDCNAVYVVDLQSGAVLSTVRP